MIYVYLVLALYIWIYVNKMTDGVININTDSHPQSTNDVRVNLPYWNTAVFPH